MTNEEKLKRIKALVGRSDPDRLTHVERAHRGGDYIPGDGDCNEAYNEGHDDGMLALCRAVLKVLESKE